MTTIVDTDSRELAATAEAAEAMAKYEIVRVPVDYFHVGEFRYTNLPDAIAEAKRRAGLFLIDKPPPPRPTERQ